MKNEFQNSLYLPKPGPIAKPNVKTFDVKLAAIIDTHDNIDPNIVIGRMPNFSINTLIIKPVKYLFKLFLNF